MAARRGKRKVCLPILVHLIIEFNGQIKVVPNLYEAGLTQLSFDLSLLGLSLAELEAGYLTTTI